MYSSCDANYQSAQNYQLQGELLTSISINDVVARFDALRVCVSTLHTEDFLAIDVTMSQARLLHVVTTQPGMSMSAIAAQLHVGLSAVSGLVDRLVEHGYLDRREDPSDRRQHLVSATAAGLAAMDRLRELDEKLVRRLLAGLSGSELSALDTGFAALVRQASKLRAAAGSTPSGRSPERTSA